MSQRGVGIGMALALLASGGEARAGLEHPSVDDGDLEILDVIAPGAAPESTAFSLLGSPRAPGRHELVLRGIGPAVRVPHCNGRGKVVIDGKAVPTPALGSVVLDTGGDGVHEVKVEVNVSTYEKRIACGERPRFGGAARSVLGLGVLEATTQASRRGRGVRPGAGGGGGADGGAAGRAVVFVPRAHDLRRPARLLVGTHPWNGSAWTYAAYRELLEEAEARDVVLMMPSGLGNSLYTADAETEVMEMLDAVSAALPVDPRRISIWGASMGGAGATTIGFHHPDRFAFVASYFGDSRYDLTTYVRTLIPDEAAARRVNALDVVENARSLPVWLIHGEADRSSPVVQSTMLFDAMKARGFQVELDRVPGMGHEGPLVARYVRRVVARAAEAEVPEAPTRVSFRGTRLEDRGAYGVVATRRTGATEIFFDVEGRPDGVHVLAATGVSGLLLRSGALGVPAGSPVHADASAGRDGSHVEVRWEAGATGAGTTAGAP